MDETGSTRHWLDDPPTVGAVLVAHNGAAWLPKVLASFADMFHAPTAWRVVDVSSTDGSADLLRDSFGAERITYAPSGTGFGEAVRLGVEAMPRTDWIWLLHDDAAVLPGTLAGLLDVATSADDIAVVGPKIREWPSLRRLLEVGLTVTNTGSRETGLETGEPDAGQHDRPRDVLAVTSAGMLVRRDVWDELGGFDPALPLYFDDIDFGWRVARAGYRTRTAPGGVMFHAEASRRGTRRRTAGDVPHWEPRRAALYTLLANTSAPHIWWQYVRLFVGSLLRVLGFLIGKDPESASDELLALRAVYPHPLEMRAARRARAATSQAFRPRHPAPVPAVLAAVPARVRRDPRQRSWRWSGPRRSRPVGRRSTLGEHGPEETEDLEDGPSLLERRPWLATVLVLIALSFVAGRGLFGGISGGALHGGRLAARARERRRLVEADVGAEPRHRARQHVDRAGVLDAARRRGDAGLVPARHRRHRPDAVRRAAGRARRAPARPPAHATAWPAHRLGGLVRPRRGRHRRGRPGPDRHGRRARSCCRSSSTPPASSSTQPGWQLGLRLGIWIAVGAAFAPVVLPLCLVGLVLLLVLEGRWVLRDGIIAALVPLASCSARGSCSVPGIRSACGGRPASRCPATPPCSSWPSAGPAARARRRSGWASACSCSPSLALVPRRSRVYVQVCWVVALIGLAFAVLGTAVTYSTPAGPGRDHALGRRAGRRVGRRAAHRGDVRRAGGARAAQAGGGRARRGGPGAAGRHRRVVAAAR